MVALLSFTDPPLARRGLGIMLDTSFDIRESGTALYFSNKSIPPRRETHEFIAANFEAMAKRVARDTPAYWPTYAAGLCSDKDRADVETFWRDRIAKYEGAERTLTQALEQIHLCTVLRAAQGQAVAAFLAKH
jgi:alanyl aminopeptidase